LAAVSLIEQGHPRFLKIRGSQLDTESVSAVAQQFIRPGSEILSDALSSFRAALRGAYVHHYHVFDKDSGALRWVHALISNVKNFLLRTCHGLGKSICRATSTNLLSASTAASGLISFSLGLSVRWLLPTSWAMMT